MSVTTVALVGNTLICARHFRDSYKNALQTKTTVIGKKVKHTLEDALSLGFEIDTLAGVNPKLRDVVKRFEEISGAYVTDRDMKILYHNDTARIGGKVDHVHYEERTRNKDAAVCLFSLADKQYYSIALPISTEEGVVGKLWIELPVAVIENEVNKLMASLFVVMAAVLGITVVLSFYWANSISKPLRRLKQGVLAISRGDHSRVDDVKSKDEVGELAMAFNNMAQNLEKSTVSIEVLEKSQKRFQDVAETSGDWIWEADAEGRYTYASRMVERMLGYKPEEMLGRHFYDVFIADRRNELKTVALNMYADPTDRLQTISPWKPPARSPDTTWRHGRYPRFCRRGTCGQGGCRWHT